MCKRLLIWLTAAGLLLLMTPLASGAAPAHQVTFSQGTVRVNPDGTLTLTLMVEHSSYFGLLNGGFAVHYDADALELTGEPDLSGGLFDQDLGNGYHTASPVINYPGRPGAGLSLPEGEILATFASTRCYPTLGPRPLMRLTFRLKAGHDTGTVGITVSKWEGYGDYRPGDYPGGTVLDLAAQGGVAARDMTVTRPAAAFSWSTEPLAADTVKATLYLTQEAGVALTNGDFAVNYDADALELTAATLNGGLFAPGTFGGMAEMNSGIRGQVPVSFAANQPIPVTGKTALLTLTFRLKTGQNSGQLQPEVYKWESDVQDLAAVNAVDAGEALTLTRQALPPTIRYGDVNGDGKIDSTDARMVLQASVHIITLTEAQAERAEVSGDNKVDSTDARMILQYEVGLLDLLGPAG